MNDYLGKEHIYYNYLTRPIASSTIYTDINNSCSFGWTIDKWIDAILPRQCPDC